MKTAKQVIDKYRKEHSIEEVTIIDGFRVIFSGNYDALYANCDPDMILYRRTVLKRTVLEVTLFNFRKLFVFLAEESEGA